MASNMMLLLFWSSVNLTGNQTKNYAIRLAEMFWSSVNLTGNQTHIKYIGKAVGFGAVSI